MTTTTKTYTKPELVAHFFKNAYTADDAFILPSGDDKYQLVYEKTERELEKMMNKGEIINYVTFDHVLSIISELDDFLSPEQLARVSSEIEF